MSQPRFDRDRFYRVLRAALFEYADLERSVDLEIFAIEMEVAPGSADSADPALLDEFNKAFPDKVTIRDGLALAADYVESELSRLRHVNAARSLVEDLRAASNYPEAMPDTLRRLFDGNGV